MGAFSVITSLRTKPDVINNDMESHKAITISEYRTAAIYSEPEVPISTFLSAYLWILIQT